MSGAQEAGLHIGIAGAGVLGRLAAWALAQAGHRVSVWDPASGPEPRSDGLGPAGFTAAGMLSPLAELDHAEPAIALAGWQGLALWDGVAVRLAARGADGLPLVRRHGSLLLAHGPDAGAAERVLARLRQAPVLHAELPTPELLSRAQLAELEPSVLPGLRAWRLPAEGQLLPAETLLALAQEAPGVRWHWGSAVQSVAPGSICTADGQRHAVDWALDLRGLGARQTTADAGADGGAASAAAAPPFTQTLRGVRGEVISLHAPGVVLRRPLRLLHARHRVYIVPRPGERIVIGASEVESEDRSPVSLRSAVELMAAAHSVLPGLAEARILHLETNLRPALPDNGPRIELQPGLLRVNGLYRHGWLLAPSQLVVAFAQAGLAHGLRALTPSAQPPKTHHD
jgi:glycine oxidase